MSVSSVYESLVQPHLEDLKKYCFALTRSKWDGEDLCQEALLRTMIYFRHQKPDHDLKPFLIRVARNVWIDGCRAQQRQRKLQKQIMPLYWTDSDYYKIRSLIEWIGERLPRRSLEMFLLADYFGCTMQEIADATGSTVPAVKSVLFRTRNLLRQSDGLTGSGSKPGEAKVIDLDVERWSRAVMRNFPPCRPL